MQIISKNKYKRKMKRNSSEFEMDTHQTEYQIARKKGLLQFTFVFNF